VFLFLTRLPNRQLREPAVSGWIARLLVAVLPMRSPLLASAHADARAIGSLWRYRVLVGRRRD
jgi:hypothetical protein